MFLGMLSKDRARWTWVMVGCALIDPSCQHNHRDHTLNRWLFCWRPKSGAVGEEASDFFLFVFFFLESWLDIVFGLTWLIGGFSRYICYLVYFVLMPFRSLCVCLFITNPGKWWMDNFFFHDFMLKGIKTVVFLNGEHFVLVSQHFWW